MYNPKDMKIDIDKLTEENKTILLNYLELLKDEDSISEEKT